MCDAAILEKKRKSAYGMEMYFDHLLVLLGAVFRCKCFSAKKNPESLGFWNS